MVRSQKVKEIGGDIYLVVPDKNNLLAAKDKRNHTLW